MSFELPHLFQGDKSHVDYPLLKDPYSLKRNLKTRLFRTAVRKTIRCQKLVNY